MELLKYLKGRDESQSAFGRRSGIPQQTVNSACAHIRTVTLRTANRIVLATGGLVSHEDLDEGWAQWARGRGSAVKPRRGRGGGV